MKDLAILFIGTVIPIIMALICFILSIITILKRKARADIDKLNICLFNVYAIFIIIAILILKHEVCDAGLMLLSCCALFDITQQTFSEKRNNIILICDVIVCVCCTASLTLSIIELVSR